MFGWTVEGPTRGYQECLYIPSIMGVRGICTGGGVRYGALRLEGGGQDRENAVSRRRQQWTIVVRVLT